VAKAALGPVAAALVLLAFMPDRAGARPTPVTLTLHGAEGERAVQATDLTFVSFHVRYRRTRAPVEESPTRERVEVLSDRDECRCVRFDDYSRVKFRKIREIEIAAPPGERMAKVRVTRLDGKSNEYPVTRLWGGTDLFPPYFTAVIDGVVREFPLVLGDAPDAAWPEEMLVRALLVKPAPPKGRRR
jgi:hypothetical protein